MRLDVLPEEVFLKNIILNAFNAQFGYKFKQTECDIRSIPRVLNYTYAYEVTTSVRNDNFILRFYFNIGISDRISPFTLKLDRDKNIPSALGDEIYEARGTIDEGYVMYNGYRFTFIESEPDLPILLHADDTPIKLANGGYILLA